MPLRHGQRVFSQRPDLSSSHSLSLEVVPMSSMPRLVEISRHLPNLVKSATQRQLSCQTTTRLSQAYKGSYASRRNIHNNNCAGFRAAIPARAVPVAGHQSCSLKPGDELTADSGLKYRIESVLKLNLRPLLYVCRAR